MLSMKQKKRTLHWRYYMYEHKNRGCGNGTIYEKEKERYLTVSLLYSIGKNTGSRSTTVLVERINELFCLEFISSP